MKSLNVPKSDLKGVNGKINTMREIVILLTRTIVVKEVVKLTAHPKFMNVFIEPAVGYLDDIAMTRSYGVLRLGVGKINV